MVRLSKLARALLLVSPLWAAAWAAAGGGCAETKRSLGDDCLKNEDCLSGICSQLRCGAAPPLLDGAPTGEAQADATADAAAETSGDAPVDTATDAQAGDAGGG